MIKKTTTFLTLLIPSSFTFSVLATNTKFVDETGQNTTNSLKKQLKKEIINNSEKINTKQYLQYDDKNFENDEQLNQYLAKKNRIEKIITTTNLGKIIKDYEFKLLNDEKIYSVNIDDYEIVYKNKNAKTAVDKQQALKSYASEVLPQKRYSYSSTVDDWHDSPEEAKERKTTNVKSSLYIYLNNKYFNVINDKEALLSNLTSGYYVNKSKFTRIKGEEKDVFGTYKYLKKVIKERYEATWINKDLWDYVDVIPEYKVKIKTKNGVLLIVDKQNSSEYILNGGTNKNINVRQIVFDENWQYHYETYSCVKKKIFTQQFINNQNNNSYLALMPLGGRLYCYTAVASPSVDLDAIDVSSVKYNLYKTKKGKDEKDSSQLLDSIASDKRIENANDLPTHIRKQFYEKWFNDYFFDSEFLKSTFSSTNQYGVEEDKLYSLNSSYNNDSFLSFKESFNYFQEVIKPTLKKNQDKYIIQGNEFTEDQINQYLYLKDYPFYKKMYNYFDSDNLTSFDGSLLSSKRWEAEERKKHYDNGVLNKKFFVYHSAQLKPELSAGTFEEAYEMFFKTLKLEAKYVHKDEIKSWKNKSVSFDSIITDGRYAVYRIINKKHKKTNQTTSYFYYQSYDDAVKSIRKSIEYKITTVNKYTKLYFYKDKNNASHIFTYKDDKEINEIIDKIISLN